MGQRLGGDIDGLVTVGGMDNCALSARSVHYEAGYAVCYFVRGPVPHSGYMYAPDGNPEPKGPRQLHIINTGPNVARNWQWQSEE